MDLGTDQGRRGSKALFARKIDPIVNGIGNMDAFKVVEKVTSELPTTIMLSNVQVCLAQSILPSLPPRH